MKLLGTFASPYVRKVRVAMAEKRLEYEFVIENVWAPDSFILQVNPLGKVPCLVMEDGSTLFDSRVIVEYIDSLSPVGKLLPTSGRERVEIKRWEALADGIADAGILALLERTQRSEAQRSEAWIARQMAKVDAGLAMMEADLGDKPFCAGNHFTLADVAVGCVLGWLSFRYPQLDWRERHPALSRLLDKLSERPSFKDTVPT